uniref:Uncharacterized protein n=1 Tax=Tetraselmis sp. GSL018 TaxID=582737 RepID=A0A061S321_9CHLO
MVSPILNANADARLDRLEALLGELRQGQNDMQKRLDLIHSEIQRVECLASARSRNAWSALSDKLCLPRGVDGLLPDHLGAISTYELCNLKRPQLKPYMEFYGLDGHNKDEEVKNLLQYLGVRYGQGDGLGP